MATNSVRNLKQYQAAVVDAVGNTTEFTYDDLDRLITETVIINGITHERSCQYDAVGNLTMRLTQVCFR